MDSRARLLGAAGLLLVVVGLVVGFWPHHVAAPDFGGRQVNCGSAFHKSGDAQLYDDLGGNGYVTNCDQARSSAAPLAYGALGLGIVGLGAAVIIWPRRQQPQEAQAG